MKFHLVIFFVLSSALCYSQHYTPKTEYGIGYGVTVDGWGDIPGKIFYLNGMLVNKSKWFTFTGRIVGTKIERHTKYGSYSTYEKSNGFNLEADANIHLNWRRLSFYLSGGPALRFSDNQYINYMGYATLRTGGFTNFEVEYEKFKGLRPGFTLGANFDLSITKNIVLGIRVAGSSFFNGSQYQNFVLTLRNKNWRF